MREKVHEAEAETRDGFLVLFCFVVVCFEGADFTSHHGLKADCVESVKACRIPTTLAHHKRIPPPPPPPPPH